MQDEIIRSGTITEIGEIQEFGGKKKLEFCIKTDEEYPQEIKLSAWKTSAFVASLRQGDEVEVNINLNGRRKGEKVYNELVAWRVNKL